LVYSTLQKNQRAYKYLEKLRTSKGPTRRLNWPHYDRAHNLGLLLHILDKGKNLPNKPSTNLSKILHQMEEKVWLHEPKGNAVIYYAFSSATNEDYVGQTTQFMIRKHKETWDARHHLKLLQDKNEKIYKARRLERRMANVGYQTWYHLPIRILGTDTTTDVRISNEKKCIIWLKPNLNDNQKWRQRKCLLIPLRNQRPSKTWEQPHPMLPPKTIVKLAREKQQSEALPCSQLCTVINLGTHLPVPLRTRPHQAAETI